MYIYADEIGSVVYIDHMGDDKRAVDSARVSLDGDDYTSNELTEKDAKLLDFLVKHKHTSPFEHSTLSVCVKVPLFVRSQIMRHRTFSFNEISRRYTSSNIEFYVPTEFNKQATKNLQCSTDEIVHGVSNLYEDAILNAFESYNELLRAGVSRETARGILPQCLYTRFYMSGNLLNWYKFLQLRLDEHAQKEVQAVAKAVLTILLDKFPTCTRLFFKDEDKAFTLLD